MGDSGWEAYQADRDGKWGCALIVIVFFVVWTVESAGGPVHVLHTFASWVAEVTR